MARAIGPAYTGFHQKPVTATVTAAPLSTASASSWNDSYSGV